MKGLHNYLKDRAGKSGYTIDAVHDLARILRPPGTINGKDGAPVQTYILEQNDKRYNPNDFDEYFATIDTAAASRSNTKVTGAIAPGLVLQPDAQPQKRAQNEIILG